MEGAKLIEMIETGGCAGLDVAIMDALGLEYNGEVLDSLDAAVALVERVRPDITAWELRSRGAKTRFVAELSKLDEGNNQMYWNGYAPTPAAALVAALLKASAP